jgi:hypothetical protein
MNSTGILPDQAGCNIAQLSLVSIGPAFFIFLNLNRSQQRQAQGRYGQF